MGTCLSRQQRLTAFLNSLGDTPDQVADKLRDWAIKGERQIPCHCPIANVLKKKFRGLQPRVRTWSVIAPDMLVNIPRPVADFIRFFDGGDYSDLAQ